MKNFFLRFTKDNYENIYVKWYWIYIIFLGLAFIFLVPPFQKPDSDFHYFNTYSVLNKSCVSDPSGGGYMNIPKDVYEFPKKLQLSKIAFSYQTKFPKSLLNEKYISSSNEFVIFNRTCVKFGWLSYFPNVIGLKLGGNNLLLGFYLSRFFGFLFFLLILLSSLKLAGRYYPLVVALSIIPMVIHQVSAISYDSAHISLGLLSFSFYLYLKNNFSKVKPYLLLAFYALLLLFSLSKGGYYLLLILPILLPPYPFFKKNTKNIIVKFLVLLFYYLLAFLLIKSGVEYVDNLRTGVFNASLQKKIILGDPFYYIKVLVDTTSKYFYAYWVSFLGNFGWLDYQSHFSILLLVTIIDIYIISKFKFGKNKINKIWIGDILEIIFILGIAVGSYVFVLTSMYLIWTPLAAKTIEGPQGRYFFIPFLFLIYGIVRFVEIVGIRVSKYIFSVIIVLVVLVDVTKAVYLRYYDYSNVFSNINELGLDDFKNYKIKNSEYKVIPVTDNKLCENVGDNKIGGFAIYFTNNLKENEYIDDVFKYEILNGDKLLFSGYLDQTTIQKEGKYLEVFNKIIKGRVSDEICVHLYKKYYDNNKDRPVLYFVEKDNVGVKLLKIAK